MKAGSRRPNQAHIAARLGVSVSTVSRALANEAGISEPVRREIRQLADALGYRSRQFPQPLPNRRALALVPLADATSGMSTFYVGVIDGMRRVAGEVGLGLEVRLIREDLVTLETIQRHLAQTESDALLLTGVDATQELVDWCEEHSVATILVNGTDPQMRLSSVSPSNFYGGLLATRRLLDAGHRHLLHYSHGQRPTILERRRGFEAAVSSVPGARGTVVSSERSAAEVIENILGGQLSVTAIFAWNDLAAAEMLERAYGDERTRRISIIGFNDLPIASMSNPRLSTIRVDREAIGASAVWLLLDRMKGAVLVEQVEIGVSSVDGGTIFPSSDES